MKMKFDRRLTDKIYTSDTVRLGKNAFQAMQETLYHNGGVGTITGYYDAELSILSVSDLLLHNLNHSYLCILQVQFCKWWLSGHKQGPLETIWHKWTWIGSK